MGLGPDINKAVDRIAMELENPRRDRTITFQTRIWNVVNSITQDKTKRRSYFYQIQRQLAARSASTRKSVAVR